MIKRFSGCLLGLAAILIMGAGCSEARPTLHLFVWEDYIDPDLVEAFEKQGKCRVVIDTYKSNESMYATLKAGSSGYDLVISSSYMAALMQGEGMLEPVDKKQIPNLKNIDDKYLQDLALDKTMSYSVPYMLSNSGIACLKSKVRNIQPTWAMLEREDIRGRALLLDDMRETLGAALKFLGYSLNTRDEAQIQQAKELVLKWKKNTVKMDNHYSGYGIASGDFILVHGYSGDLLEAVEENPDIVYLQPAEGVSISCDDFVILKGSKEKGLAHAFVHFLHDPSHAAQNTTFLFYLCPNRPSYALLDKEIIANTGIFVPPEILARSEVVRDLGDDNKKYIKAWNEIKAAAD